MTATHHPQTGTATAVPWERASANHAPMPHQTVWMPPATSNAAEPAPIRRRVERITVRYAPQPPQTAQKSVSTLPGSRKSLDLNRQIKAQSAR
jgi:hypothetical protein